MDNKKTLPYDGSVYYIYKNKKEQNKNKIKIKKICSTVINPTEGSEKLA